MTKAQKISLILCLIGTLIAAVVIFSKIFFSTTTVSMATVTQLEELLEMEPNERFMHRSNLEMLVAHVQEKGLPEAGSYSAHHVVGTSSEDMDIKLRLIMASYDYALATGAITADEHEKSTIVILTKMATMEPNYLIDGEDAVDWPLEVSF